MAPDGNSGRPGSKAMSLIFSQNRWPPKAGLIICLLALTFLSQTLILTRPPSGLDISTDRKEYFRYQLIRLSARPDSSLNLDGGAVSATAKFFCGDSLVSGVGQMDEIRLRWDPETKTWHGAWALPWNPPLGRYRAVISVAASESLKLCDSVDFIVKARTPKPIPPGFCVMTIESAGNLLNARLPSPLGHERRWQNFAHWAKFLGADAVWYSVGWTIEGARGISDSNPWIKDNFKVFPKLAAECRAQGLLFGGYVSSYLLWGPNLRKLKYDYSLESSRGKIYPNHHVNLDDPKRRADVIKVLRQLEDDPNVNFIGLDYIRPGPGGFESVDSFTVLMNIDVPKNWGLMDRRQRMLWVAQRVRPLSYTPIHLRWQWWQAHRTATTVERILAEAKVAKPVWGFTLGWDKGHEHGQDPVMMNDAGLDIDAVMLYESNAWHCFNMTNQWSKYLRGDEAQIIAGQQVDWELLQKSTDPPAPEEMYIRHTDAIRGLSSEFPLKGLFWHDLFRGIRGRKGPHNSKEWLIAGAAAFTRVREELGLMPISVRLSDENGRLGLKISCPKPLTDLRIEPLTSLSPCPVQEIDSLTGDTAMALGRSPARGLVAYRLWWGDGPRQQYVLFAYFPRAYAQQPFRRLQSFRAGGDVLIVNGLGAKGLATVDSIGRHLRALGFIVNRTDFDSLEAGIENKYRNIILISHNRIPASWSEKSDKIFLWYGYDNSGQSRNLDNLIIIKDIQSLKAFIKT